MLGLPRRSTQLPTGDAAAALPTAALFFVAYVALTWVSFVYPMRGSTITPWNPQAALAVAFLVRHATSWPLVWLAVGCAEASVASDPMRVAAFVVASGGMTAAYACTAAAVRRWLGPDLSAFTRRSAVVFLGVMAGGAVIASSLRAGALWAVGAVHFAQVPVVLHRALVGDGVGLVVTLPVLLVLGSETYRAASKAMLRSVESWLVALVSALAIVAVFQQSPAEEFKFFYLLFAPVVWASVRFGAVGAVWSAALVQVLLILAVRSGNYQPLTVFELQMLMATLSSTGVLLGAVVDEKAAVDEALRASLRVAAAGDMAAALAHELNQPLTAISTYARACQALARRLPAGDAATQPIEDVASKLSAEAARAGEVVNRLRRFFREGSTDLQPVDIGEVLAESIAAQSRRAQEFEVQLVLDDSDGLPAVWADRVQLAVVLRNLLANAIEAASDSAPAAGERSVHVGAEQEGQEIIVTVADNGPGLTSEQARRVFETRGSAKPGGMGIGLAISRAILDAHGGRLWAEPGHGGTFRFALPIGTGGLHGA